MKLLKEILVRAIEKEEVHVTFPNLNISIIEMFEIESFKALQKIKTIIDDDSLSDFECIEGLLKI